MAVAKEGEHNLATVVDRNKKWYAVINVLDEHLTMWSWYERNRPIRKQLNELKPRKQAKFREEYHAELAMYDRACNHFDELLTEGTKLTPKAWKKERDKLTAEKDKLYKDMHKLRDNIRDVENIRKTLDELMQEETAVQKQPQKRRRDTPEL